MAQLILSQTEGQSLYKVYVQPGQEYMLYGKVITSGASSYALREVNVTGQVISNTEIAISDTAGLQEFSRVFDSSNATIMLIIALTGAEVMELSLDGPQGVVYVTSPISNMLKHVSQFDVLISYLDRAFEVKISSKLNGDNRLIFNLHLDDEKGLEIVNENFIECYGQKYTVKSIKDDDMLKTKTIEAEHIGLSLIDYWLYDTLGLPSVSAVVALEAILAETPYTVGTVNVTGVNDLEIEICNKLKAVKTVQELWGGELYFDNYEVNLVQQMGQDNGIQFRKKKNLDQITRTLDTNTLTTKMFGYGKDSLVITGLDTTGWTEEQKAGLQIDGDGKISAPHLTSQFIDSYAREYQGEFRNSDIGDRQELLDAMRKALTECEVPRVTYETEIVNLSGLAQYVGEGFGLGDTVKVIDECLGIDVKARIVEYDQYPFEPWRDKAVLANFTQNLQNYLVNLDAMKEVYDRAFTKGKISTAWLEGIINVLRNELIAETANVTITDTDGILIVNGDGTKALQLKGGIFAIANSKMGSSWNWRTFGTGDGFTADCIVAGKLLTNLVQIVGEENKFYMDETGLYAVEGDEPTTYMLYSKEGLKGFKNGSLRLWLGPYALDKFGLLLKAKDGITTMLNEDGILQTWQLGGVDNVDGSHPLKLSFYIPEGANLLIGKCFKLGFTKEAFRAYETGAEAGGAVYTSTESGGYSATSTDNGDIDLTSTQSSGGSYETSTPGVWTLSSPQYLLPDFMNMAGDHSHGGDTGGAGTHNHGISNGTLLLTEGGSVGFVESGYHSHNIYSDGNHAHSMYSVAHSHSVSIPSHSHGISVPAHNHSITLPYHQHNVSIGSHNHGLVFGIYEGGYSDNISIVLDGVNITTALGGPFHENQVDIDLSNHIFATGWHTLELGSSQLGRINASLFIQLFMQI